MKSETLFDFNEFSQNWTSGSIIADSQFADDKWTLFKKVFFNNRVFFETKIENYSISIYAINLKNDWKKKKSSVGKVELMKYTYTRVSVSFMKDYHEGTLSTFKKSEVDEVVRDILQTVLDYNKSSNSTVARTLINKALKQRNSLQCLLTSTRSKDEAVNWWANHYYFNILSMLKIRLENPEIGYQEEDIAA